jgi:semaphorin 6
MDEAVSAFFTRPLLVRVSLEYRFTKIAVDWQVGALDGKAYDVLFIGTDHGKVIKALNLASFDSHKAVNSIVIEELQVLPLKVAVKDLYVAHMDGESKLVVVSDDEIRAVKLQRCSSDKITNCRECVDLQDPYCAWDIVERRCTAVGSRDWSADKEIFIQNIAVGEHKACGRVTTPSDGKPPVYTAKTLSIVVATSSLACLGVGFVAGFFFSRFSAV